MTVSEHLRQLRAKESGHENALRWTHLRQTRAWRVCEQYHQAVYRLGGRQRSTGQQLAIRMQWTAREAQIAWDLATYGRVALARWTKQLRNKARKG